MALILSVDLVELIDGHSSDFFAVAQAAPAASVDDHRAWIERMRSMTGATVFAGIGILALVIAVLYFRPNGLFAAKVRR